MVKDLRNADKARGGAIQHSMLNDSATGHSFESIHAKTAMPWQSEQAISSPSRASLSEFRIKDGEAHRCDQSMYLGGKSIPDAGGMPPYLHSVASVVFFGWRCHHTTKHFMHHARNCSIACFWPLKDTIWAASSAGSGLRTQNPASLHGQEHDGGGPHCAPQATRTKSHEGAAGFAQYGILLQ